MKISLLCVMCSILLGCVNFGLGDKPNIIFIMSDDHTWQAVGSYESRFKYLNPTPNLDKLAKRGMVSIRSFVEMQYVHLAGQV